MHRENMNFAGYISINIYEMPNLAKKNFMDK